MISTLKANFLKCAFAAVFLCMLVLLSGCSSSSQTPTDTGTSQTQQSNQSAQASNNYSEASKQIVTTAGKNLDNSLSVIVLNNNDFGVKVTITATFYDANKAMLGSDSETIYSLAQKSDFAVEMKDYKVKSFDSFEIVVKNVEEPQYEPFSGKDLSFTSNDTGKQITVELTNSSQNDFSSAKAACVFYVGERIVGYDYDLENPGPTAGSKAAFKIDYPTDSKYNKIKFDSFKVFINAYGELVL